MANGTECISCIEGKRQELQGSVFTTEIGRKGTPCEPLALRMGGRGRLRALLDFYSKALSFSRLTFPQCFFCFLPTCNGTSH